MLYITLRTEQSPYVRTIAHKLGGSLLEEGEVISVEAGGAELQHIRDRLPPSSLPDVPNKRVVNWFGDHAKFIVHNLF